MGDVDENCSLFRLSVHGYVASFPPYAVTVSHLQDDAIDGCYRHKA